MRVSQAKISSKKTTSIPLGASRTWRAATATATILVAVSATLARQHIAATAATAIVDDPPASHSFSGTTRPLDVRTIALPTPVVVKQILVDIGDRVRAGQLLLALDLEQEQREIEQLRLELEDAKSQTVQLTKTIEILDRSIEARAAWNARAAAELATTERLVGSVPNRVKSSLESAQTVYGEAVARERRAAALAAHGVFARQELEQAQIAVRAAADNLEAARRAANTEATLAEAHALQARTQADVAFADQQQQREQRLAELLRAERRQRAAQIALDKATAPREGLTVRAPCDGVVAELLVRTGDRTRAGSPLVKVANMNPMIVDVDVPSSFVNTLARGDGALVQLVESGQQYPGHIRTVAPLPGKTAAHTIEIEFENPTAALLVGRTAQVRVSVHQ